jgi:salicylate hydroxylase
MEIAIVGGGIAGLASAIALAQPGRSIGVLERSADFEEHGAGVQLGPNGVRALKLLGVWPELEHLAFLPPHLRFMDALTGETVRCFSLECFAARFGAPYCVAHRRDLIGALVSRARALKSIKLLTGQEVTALGWQDERPVLTSSSGERFSPAAVVGADGINSVIRASLIGDGSALYHGHAIYRALIPRITAPAVPSDVVLWFYPGGHVVHYPVAGGRDINIVAVIEDLQQANGRAREYSSAEVLAQFEAVSPDLRYILGLPQAWSRWHAADRLPAKPWGKSTATLAGDAAHPMLPYLAQGAVAALEDAVTLGKCVASSGVLSVAFRQYEGMRHAHTSRLQARARAQGELYHWRGWRAAWRNRILKHIPQRYFFSRIEWLYGWNEHSVR